MELGIFGGALSADAADLRGLEVRARDGAIGRVRDVVEEAGAAYLVVDVGSMRFSRTVKLAVGVVRRVDVQQGCVFVDRARDEIESAPAYHPASPGAAADAGPAERAEIDSGPADHPASLRATADPGPAQHDESHDAFPPVSHEPAPVDVSPSPGPTTPEGRADIGAPQAEPTPAALDTSSPARPRPDTADNARPATSERAPRSEPDARERAEDAPIARYDSLTAAEVTARLPGLSQRELAAVERYEKRHGNRQTVLRRVTSLREDEPWQGYDEATVDEVRAKLSGADAHRLKTVRDYERRHRDRKGVMDAARRALQSA